MRIPEGHNDKYTLSVWKRRDKRVQKSFEEQLKESINKRKAKVEKKIQKSILDTIIQRKWNVEKIKKTQGEALRVMKPSFIGSIYVLTYPPNTSLHH